MARSFNPGRYQKNPGKKIERRPGEKYKHYVARRKRITAIRKERDKLELKQGVKQLRRFAKGFDAKNGYDLRHVDQWSKHQKAKARKYYRELHAYMSRANYIYRPRRKDRLKKAIRYGQMEPLPGWKAALIPTPAPDKTRVKVSRAGRMSLNVAGVRIMEYFFNIDHFLHDPDAALSNVKNQFETIDVPNVTGYQTMVGKHVVADIRDLDDTLDRIAGWIDNPKYQAGGHHYWKDWLKGIRIIRGENPGQMVNVLNEFSNSRRDALDESEQRRRRLYQKARKEIE